MKKMNVCLEPINLIKRIPLTISRGTRQFSENVLVTISDGKYHGIGEFDASVALGDTHQSREQSIRALTNFTKQYDLEKYTIQETWQLAQEYGLAANALAGLDIARWDLLGKQYHIPCYRLFGLSRHAVPTSITLGITTLDLIDERVTQLLSQHPFSYLKIKLGSPNGIAFDQAAFLKIKQAAQPYHVKLRVDANGGWNLKDAQFMCQWLTKQGVDYVEQPLAVNCDDQLPELYNTRSLPIFVDESCLFSTDIPKLADRVDGINLKLMKCGGLTEALKMVATARAHGLKTMIGCMSESSIAISAAASIGALFDYIDLDSHLNLNPDPAIGAELIDGVVTPNNHPGHGATLC